MDFDFVRSCNEGAEESSASTQVLTLLFTSGIVIDTAAAASNSNRMIYRAAACSRNKVA